MTIVIPMWIVWTVAIVIGFPAIVFILVCAWIGFQFVSSDGRWF